MKKTAIFLMIGLVVLLSSCSAPRQSEKSLSSSNKKQFLVSMKKQLKENYTDVKQKTADADAALKQAEEKPNEENYASAKSAVEAVPYKVIELTSRLKAIQTTLDVLAEASADPDDPQPGNAENEQSAQDRYWEAINNGANQDAALAYADGRTDSYQAETQTSEDQSIESTEPATLTEFIDQYGMTPVAYKIKVEGMSEEEALRSTPREMKTSGELQTGYTTYGIRD